MKAIKGMSLFEKAKGERVQAGGPNYKGDYNSPSKSRGDCQCLCSGECNCGSNCECVSN